MSDQQGQLALLVPPELLAQQEQPVSPVLLVRQE